MARIRALVGQVVLPPGVSLELGGQYVTQRAAFRQLLLVFGLAAGAVLLVLVIQFGSMRGPLMIVAAACLGVAGALAALVGAGTPLNISSFMGLILLVGLVVKNGIILLDAARAFYRSGLDSQEALARAAEVRLRPILMTTLCTLAGLIPLAFGIGSGAELQQPLAIAVTGGLAFSTAVTLLLLPAGLAAVGAVEAGNRRGESYHEDASF
jgi:multidrug efflux pump subunit AcrB